MKLFKKKEALVRSAEDNASTPNNARSEQHNVGKKLSYWLYQPAVLVVAILFSIYILIDFLFIQENETAKNNNIKSLISATLKLNIDTYINQKIEGLDSLAKSSALSEVLVNGKGISTIEETLKSIWTDLDQVYVIPKSDDLVIKGKYPELSFASVEIVRRVLSGEHLKAEAFYQNDDWRFQISVPIKSVQMNEIEAKGESLQPEAANTVILGAILATFKLDAIPSLLNIPHGLPSGEAALVSSQGVKGKNIIRVGKGDTQQATYLPTAISQWRVRYSPSAGQLGMMDRAVIWIVFGLGGVVLLVGLFILCRNSMNQVRLDLLLAGKSIAKYVFADGKVSEKFLFTEIYSMTLAISQQARKKIKELERKVHETSVLKASSVEKANHPQKDESDTPLFDDDLLDLDLLAEADTQNDINLDGDDDTIVTEVERLDFDVPQSIFRAYDIRGIVDETLNEGIVELLGKAIASEALSLGQKTLCVGYDGRLSSVDYCEALTRGIISTGIDAIVIGQVPTPVLYFSTHHFETGSGVMITGSHNPSNYNGFKMMLGGNTLSGDDIQKIYNRIILQDFSEGQGSRSDQEVDRDYLDTILNDIAVAAPLKVVVDAGNGVAGGLAPELIEELGCEVIPLFCEVDGTFPNHHPDPGKPENLQDLIAAVKEHDADIGLAFDGDGDRLGVVTNEGKIIWPDRLLMLFAKDVVSRNPGADIIFDVKCSRRINGLITSYGGRPIMWKTGHSLIKAKMKETGALLAGEMSGHVFFKERWYGFDDGLYSAARLLEILGIEDKTAHDVFAEFPEDISTPEINITVTDESKFELIEKLYERKDQFTGGNISTIDGLRVDYPNGWGLCRASNTTPVLVLRFEADDESALEEIKAKFVAQLKSIDPSLDCDF